MFTIRTNVTIISIAPLTVCAEPMCDNNGRLSTGFSGSGVLIW